MSIFYFRFYEKYRIPGVVGCIDCTHVAIVKPTEHEERFFNRKHFHSINAQVVSLLICMQVETIILNMYFLSNYYH